MTKRVYPHLLRHQRITYWTQQGIIRPKLQLLSGHRTEHSAATDGVALRGPRRAHAGPHLACTDHADLHTCSPQ